MREECGDFPSCLKLFRQAKRGFRCGGTEGARSVAWLVGREADGGEEIMELQKTNLEKESPNCTTEGRTRTDADGDEDDLIEDKVISALRHT